MEPSQAVGLAFAIVAGFEQILGGLPAGYPHSFCQLAILGGKTIYEKIKVEEKKVEEIELKVIKIHSPPNNI